MPGPFCSSIDQRNILGAIARSLLLVTALLVVIMGMALAGLRLNVTPSVPTGFYWIVSDPRAPFVEFCPPEPFGVLSVERGYRARTLGGCPDGGVPLLKSIVARPGDIVELSPRGLSVNRIPVPNTAPKPRDSAGRALISWCFGRYEVARGTIWVPSSHNSRSFDSRYFGPVNEGAIKHRLRPIWTE